MIAHAQHLALRRCELMKLGHTGLHSALHPQLHIVGSNLTIVVPDVEYDIHSGTRQDVKSAIVQRRALVCSRGARRRGSDRFYTSCQRSVQRSCATIFTRARC
jgi:hypothetical protein